MRGPQTTDKTLHTVYTAHGTVDRENFTVKTISRSWLTAKIKHAKKKTYAAMINRLVCAQVHTPRGKCQNDDYMQPAILGSPDTW